MIFPIRGLHHVTATVSDAQEDLDFYITLLGLRLVKKTVNFDNNQVYLSGFPPYNNGICHPA